MLEAGECVLNTDAAGVEARVVGEMSSTSSSADNRRVQIVAAMSSAAARVAAVGDVSEQEEGRMQEAGACKEEGCRL